MLSSLSVTACGSGGAVADGDVLASVGTSMLTVDDLRDNTPLGLSSEDSVLFCRSGTEKIDKMVEEYRNDLIMKEYKRLMYEENGGRWFSVDTLKSYYDNHKSDFILKKPLVRGIFLKLPQDAPRLQDVRKWYCSDNSDDIERLEKYTLQDAVQYDYRVEYDRMLRKLLFERGVKSGDVKVNVDLGI